MKKYTVVVTQEIEVTVDETKFDKEFMTEFRESMYNFYTIEDHMAHLAQLYARGIIDDFNNVAEGYGSLKDMGISFKLEDQDEEITSEE
jgi:hypothetical protein